MKEKDDKILSENTENGKAPENKPSLSEMYYGSNTDTFSESEKMDRTYLKELYGEDMDFLNKEVRMTRSQYVSMYNEIEMSYSERIKDVLKSLLPIIVLYAVAIVLAVIFRKISNEFYELMLISDAGNPKKAAAYISGIFMAFSRVIFLSTSAILIITVITSAKNIRRFNRYKKHSLEQLENRKAECMSAGQYDAENKFN